MQRNKSFKQTTSIPSSNSLIFNFFILKEKAKSKFSVSFDSTIKISGSLAGSAADFGPYLIHNAALTD